MWPAATLLLLSSSLIGSLPSDRPAALRAVEEGILVLRALRQSGSNVVVTLAESLRTKGDIRAQDGKSTEAIAAFEESLSLFQSCDNTDGAAGVLISLASEMEETGEAEKGVRFLDRAVALVRLLPAHDAAVRRARIAACRGDLMFCLRRFDEALACRKDALERDTLLFGRSSREAAESLSMLASAYDDLRQTDLAKSTFLSAIL